MKAKILKAKQEDAIQIASLIKNGWNAAYKGIISDEFLRNMDEKKLVGNWLKSIENGENNYVYKMNNEILGVIRFGKAERPVTPNEGEGYVLYVKVEEKRKGIGTELLTFAKQELKQNGFNKMIIWCLKGNVQGANFYNKNEGIKVKERDYKISGINVREEGFYFNLREEEKIVLVKPTIAHKSQAQEMMEEAKKYDADDPDIWAGYACMEECETYEEWLKLLEEDLDFEKIKLNRVPAATYFCIRKSDNKIIGIINIRYYLNEFLENYGGHIGYSIRATERRKGYGRKQLELGLEKCLEIPIDKVLITCRERNIGSSKVIENCGGIYEDTRFCKEENDNLKRYWINL